MEMSRRRFLAGAGFLGLDLGETVARAGGGETAAPGKITTTICPFCAVGCGMLVTSAKDPDGRTAVVHVEGDPDHPINEGTLCSKGASLPQLANNEHRLRKVLYRAPGASEFQQRDWEWAAREIARRIKKTRDETFAERNADGAVVRRTTAIASVGSAALDNEECWLYQKMLRALGLVYIEHQARL